MPIPVAPPMVPHVEEHVCHLCQACKARAACKTKAVMILDPGESPYIDGSRCRGCLVCVPACPFGAVVL
mgnify:CR=1 FL=1